MNAKIIGFLSICIVLLLSNIFFNEQISLAAEIRPAQPVFQVAKQPEIQAVRPRRPIKIRLHRSPKGEYGWDITGENADEVVRADTRLRKLLKID